MRGVLMAIVLLAAAEAWALDPGQPAPDTALTTMTGNQTSLAAYRGKWALVNFWATWCAPCRREMPLIEDVHRRYASRGFTALGVNVYEKRDRVEKFVAENGITFPILLDAEGAAMKAFSASALPHTVLINPKGIVERAHTGPMTSETLEEWLKPLAGK